MNYLELLQERVAERHERELVPVEAASGLIREAAEYFHLADSWNHDGKVYNEGDALLELGDVLHYLMEARRDHGVSIMDVARINLLKMEARDKGEGRMYERAFHELCLSGELSLSMHLDTLEASLSVVSR